MYPRTEEAENTERGVHYDFKKQLENAHFEMTTMSPSSDKIQEGIRPMQLIVLL